MRQQPPGRDFLIIGHRGAPDEACENTLASFTTALDLGANALELDVSMTRDKNLVLWHDWSPTIISDLRATGVCRIVHPPQRQPVHMVPLHEFVRDYGYEHAGQHVPILTLTEFVRHFARDRRARFFFLDLKIPADCPDLVSPLFQQAVQTLRRYGALRKAVFLTPYETILSRLQDEAQRWQRTTGTRVEIAFDTEGPQLLQLSEWSSAVQSNQQIGARFAFWGEPVISLQSWHDFLIAELRRRDAANATRPPQARMRFIVWTINGDGDFCTLVGFGVDGIITDNPARLHAMIQNWGQPGSCRS
jgi:glycerophosphoryl diester phosphodiesterase